TVVLFASDAEVTPLPSPAGASGRDHEYHVSVLSTASSPVYLLAGASTGPAPALTSLQSYPGSAVASVAPPPVTSVQGGLSVSLKRSASSPTDDLALSSIIRRAADAISFDRYMEFMNWIFCGENPKHDVARRPSAYEEKLRLVDHKRFLPFTDTDGYRNIK